MVSTRHNPATTPLFIVQRTWWRLWSQQASQHSSIVCGRSRINPWMMSCTGRLAGVIATIWPSSQTAVPLRRHCRTNSPTQPRGLIFRRAGKYCGTNHVQASQMSPDVNGRFAAAHVRTTLLQSSKSPGLLNPSFANAFRSQTIRSRPVAVVAMWLPLSSTVPGGAGIR